MKRLFKIFAGANEEATQDVIDEPADISAGPIGGDVASGANAESGWYLLAPYGDHELTVGRDDAGRPVKVMQRFDKEAANEMVRRFGSAARRLLSTFGIGRHSVHVYRGHPDDAQRSGEPGHEDTTVYADVNEMEAREDGLWGKLDWKPEWEALNSRGRFRFSPRWSMRMEDALGKVWRPFKLISMALTPRPNIPTAAWANDSQAGHDAGANNKKTKDKRMKGLMTELLLALGFPQARIDATASNEADAVSVTEAKAAIDTLKTERDAANTAKDTAETEAANAKAAVDKERKERAEEAVNSAVEAGRITQADRDGWRDKLVKAENFAEAVNELPGGGNGQGPKTAANSRSEGLGPRKVASTAKARFAEAVNERVNAGYDRAKAEEMVLNTPEGRDLYEQWQDESKPADS